MTLDKLVVSLFLDASGFVKGQKDALDAAQKGAAGLVSAAEKGEKAQTGSADRIAKALERIAAAGDKLADEQEVQHKRTVAATDRTTASIEGLARKFLGLYALVTGGQGLKQFVSDVTAADAAVGRTAKNLDMSGKALSTWQGVAVVTGGSAEGITASMSGLSNAMQTAALTGNNTLAPVFRALGIDLATTGGKARDVGAIMFDLNRKYNEMHIDPARFSAMMKMVGMDDGTINLLERSQAEFRKLYDEQQKYAASAEDLDAAQKRQDGWRSLILSSTSFGRTILTAVTPAIVGVMKGVQGWANANQEWIKTAIVEKVGEFVTWLKQLDWNAIGKGAQEFVSQVGGIATALRDTAKEVGADSALFKAFEVFGALLLGAKVLGAINAVTTAVLGFGKLPVPPLLSKMLGLAGAVAVGASAESTPDADTQKRMDDFYREHPDSSANPFTMAGNWWKKHAATWAGGDSPEAKARADDTVKRQAEVDAATAAANAKTGQSGSFWTDTWNYLKGKIGLGDDSRTKEHIEDTAKATGEMRDILKRQADAAALGGDAAGGGGSGGGGGRGGSAGMPNLRYGRGSDGHYRHGRGSGGDPNGAFNPRAPDKPGMYRPEYKLGERDLDDYVVGTIAGEAVTSNPESVDAVINNMMNRLGTKGWGPSANLHDVASAPGQYAGHRRATAQEAERIRARIRAIASGGVPDNTNGSNSYRAAYYKGPWAQQHAADGRVVGGNRFAYEPGVPNGPYAPYKEPHGTPTVGVTPAPAPGTVIGDQAALDAQRRIASGKGTPADHALIEAHRRQQNAPAPAAAPVTADVYASAKRVAEIAKGRDMSKATEDERRAVERVGPIIEAYEKAHPNRVNGPHGTYVERGKPLPTWTTKGADGAPMRTSDMRDPRFAPKSLDPARQKLADAMRAGVSSTPATAQHGTVHHALQQVLGAIHRADRLTRHDGKPVPVVDKDALQLHERTFGKFVGWGRRHPEALDHARALMHGSHAALDYHRAVMAGSSLHHSSVTHTAHHYDNSTDTRIGELHVHSRAEDARGVAADLRPYLFQGRDARQANRGLA